MSEQLSRAEELRQKRDHWKRHIETWQASGLLQSEYCRRHNLSYHRFIYWKKRFVKSETATKFVPLNFGQFPGTPALESGCPLRLVLSEGFTIEINPGFDPRLLQQLIIALRAVK
jgi:hypothetical protein